MAPIQDLEAAYAEVSNSLYAIMANGGSHSDVEHALIETLEFDRSDAVLAACIDVILDFHPKPDVVPASTKLRDSVQADDAITRFRQRGWRVNGA